MIGGIGCVRCVGIQSGAGGRQIRSKYSNTLNKA